MVAPAGKRVTYAKYMAFTETAEQKYEYIDGQMYAMSGGTIAHGRPIAQMSLLLGSALKGRPCVVMPAERAGTHSRSGSRDSSAFTWCVAPSKPTR